MENEAQKSLEVFQTVILISKIDTKINETYHNLTLIA